MRRWQLLSLLMVPLFACGCDAQDALGFKIDLSQLNWQTGALIALTYLANSKGHFAAIARSVRTVLQQFRILPSDTSKEALTAAELAKILADLFARLQGQPELQAQVMQLMTAASKSAATEAVTNASK